ncbi:MAG: SET domain-containing protein-lysine N-methyltransferase [Proteobacteria bacterium]|nr:SET domain-containing protein-lysine N-methyltransferase [Pseudomonadota bacterium]
MALRKQHFALGEIAILDVSDKCPAHIQRYFEESIQDTPYLLIDIAKVEETFKRLTTSMPDARHYYAIKANPHPHILQSLVALGGYFEVASVGEINMCIDASALPEKILYGNPLKKEKEIATAYQKGIREFVFDEFSELQKIARSAPGSKVICRIVSDGTGAVSPLTVKFGCLFEKAEEWLKAAPELGLVPYGVSFHTGSQQLNPESWEKPMLEASRIFDALALAGYPLSVVDVGGGFPVMYRADAPPIEAFAKAILKYANTYFKTSPTLYTEPGRYLCGEAGYILSEVVQISQDYQNHDLRWVYLDIGRYGGLVEEKIDYPVLSNKTGETGRVILAGQTCDSNDVIYQECFDYQLPLSLQEGDKVVLAYTGAYTTTYSTTLNGFPALQAFTIRTKTIDSGQPCIYPEDFLKLCQFSNQERALFPKIDSVRLQGFGEYGVGLVAMRDFVRGEIIGTFTGIIDSEIKQHTLQVDASQHLYDPHFIGYLLHNCDPNAVLDMRQHKVYCIKDIRKGEQLTMDYASTEDHLFRQFPCLCDAKNCRLWITGRNEKISEDGHLYLTDYQMKQTASVTVS